MGLLDDAIREHLDLMRRRGADPAEIARMEQEALGPVVRRERTGADGPHAEPVGDARDHAHAVAHDDLHDAGHGEQQALSVDPTLHVDHSAHAEAGTHPVLPAERHEGAHGDPLVPAHHDPSEPHHAPADAPEADHAAAGDDTHAASAQPPVDDPRHSDIVLQPTTEFHIEDHEDEPGADPSAHAPEDVLEETPDFLQETPEHDRLWFEQRPPRDFDFDK